MQCLAVTAEHFTRTLNCVEIVLVIFPFSGSGFVALAFPAVITCKITVRALCSVNNVWFEMKMWSSQLLLRFKQSQSKPEKCFRGFNEIRTHGLSVSAAVLHQLSYEDPYVESRLIYWIHRTHERNDTYEYYVNCGHTNEVKMWSSQLWLRCKQSQSKPEKCFRAFNGIQTHGLCVSAAVLHQLSYEDPYIDHSSYDELNKLACSQSQSQLRWSHLHFIRMSAFHKIFKCMVYCTGKLTLALNEWKI